MKNTKLLRLIGVFCGGALLIAAFFLFFGAFLSWNTGFGGVVITASGYDLTFGDGAHAGITTAWVFSLLLFVSALVACVLLILDLAGIFSFKALDNKALRFGLATCIGVFAVVTGILLFCVRPLADAAENGIGLGAGAVFAAICTIIGGCSLCCGVALPGMKK